MNTEMQTNTKNVRGHVELSTMARMMWKNMLAAQMSSAYGIRFLGLPPKLKTMFMTFMRTLVP